MSVLTTKPKFLYPYLKQFPFDDVAEKIVKAIEKRNWKVPGITIEFNIYGSGEAKYQMIECITGNDFKLRFLRSQGSIDDSWNDVAALHEIYIPKQMLRVDHDESCSYYLYVGKNWKADKEWFMNSLKVHAKLNKEPRRYLLYNNYYHHETNELVVDNDLRREYSPKGNEPVRLNLEQKYNEFALWLKEFVLDYILSFPEADVIEPPTPMEELIPYNGPWDTVFSICDWRDAERITKGKEDSSKLPPYERSAHISGFCLAPLSCKGNFPKIAYKSFLWCDINQKHKSAQDFELMSTVMDEMCTLSILTRYFVAIKLKYANSVYVIDSSKFEETRQRIFKDIAPRNSLTDDELNIAFAARATTIVPINEYKGDYKEPILLVGRELDFEEIDWMIKVTN